jgi:hypothetical protein
MNKYFLFSVLNLRVVEAWNEWAITVHGSCEDKTCKFKKLVFERKIVPVSGGASGMVYYGPRHTLIRTKESFEALYIYCLNYRYTIFYYSYTGVVISTSIVHPPPLIPVSGTITCKTKSTCIECVFFLYKMLQYCL